MGIAQCYCAQSSSLKKLAASCNSNGPRTSLASSNHAGLLTFIKEYRAESSLDDMLLDDDNGSHGKLDFNLFV